MSTFSLPPDVLRRKADHEFFVANWPDRLRWASQLERQLLGLMSHPCYRLTVELDAQGIERLHVKPSPGMPSPVTEEARAHIQRHRSDLMAFVRHTEAINKKLREAGL